MKNKLDSFLVIVGICLLGIGISIGMRDKCDIAVIDVGYIFKEWEPLAIELDKLEVKLGDYENMIEGWRTLENSQMELLRKLRQDLVETEENLYDAGYDQIYNATVLVAKERKIKLVLRTDKESMDKGSVVPRVIYEENVDITNAVIAKLNEIY